MFEIMFNDLKPEAQERFLKYMGLKDASEGNYEVVPITMIDYNDDDEDEDDENVDEGDEADMDKAANHQLTFDCPDDVVERDDGGIDLAFADVLLNGDHPEDYHVGETVDIIFETNTDFTQRFRIEENQPSTGTIVLGGPVASYDASKEDLKMPWERY